LKRQNGVVERNTKKEEGRERPGASSLTQKERKQKKERKKTKKQKQKKQKKTHTNHQKNKHTNTKKHAFLDHGSTPLHL